MPLRAFQQFQLYSVQSDHHSGARSVAKSGDDEDNELDAVHAGNNGDDKDEAESMKRRRKARAGRRMKTQGGE